MLVFECVKHAYWQTMTTEKTVPLETYQQLKNQYDQLRHQLGWLKRQLFGRKSEKRLLIEEAEQSELFIEQNHRLSA